MPFQSDKQRKAMYAAAAGRGTVGISQDAAKQFIKHSSGDSKMGNALLDFVKEHTSVGKKLDLKPKYDQINADRQAQGKPPLPPYEEWVKTQGK